MYSISKICAYKNSVRPLARLTLKDGLCTDRKLNLKLVEEDFIYIYIWPWFVVLLYFLIQEES